MVPNLVYIHIGKKLPEYIYDSVYQSLIVNKNVCIYVLIDDTLLSEFNKRVSEFNLTDHRDFVPNVISVPLSIVTGPSIDRFNCLSKQLPAGMTSFRDGFWISTTSRFFYIQQFMQTFRLTDVFHMENDIMLYEDLVSVYQTLECKDTIYMVQDNPRRVIPSILFIPNSDTIQKLTDFILDRYTTATGFLNDMDLLGSYPDKKEFPFNMRTSDSFLIFDGAAIGQYLGGVDPNNLPKGANDREDQLKKMCNPSKRFVNESCDFKIADDLLFFRKSVILNHIKHPIELVYAKLNTDDNIKQIANLHIHSKQLYQFSSVLNLKYTDIITGDRVLDLCDYIITTPGILNYHRNIESSYNKTILISDFTNVNVELLNDIFSKFAHRPIKIFIYTHILDDFIDFIFPKIDSNIEIVVYLHNSDHPFGTPKHITWLKNSNLKRVFAQNANTYKDSVPKVYNKVTALPIGLANSMFKHGDLLALYKTISETYTRKKTKNIYININPGTFSYRAEVLKYLGDQNITQPKPFEEYLQDLAEHRFCLCVRGNGVDSHRFFESLYLNTIPVIINNSSTQMTSFVEYLKNLDLVFFEIREESLETISEKYFKTDFFNETLYQKLMNGSLASIEALKIRFYDIDREF